MAPTATGTDYSPYVTSYDYDAPLSESGRTTIKYNTFRDMIARVTQQKLPDVPATPDGVALNDITFSQAASLWDNLPEPVQSVDLKTMEDLGQAYGQHPLPHSD